jgi:putative addiction module component (TIGR02574 family)
MDMATAIEEIDSWPIEDRLELVQQVWDRMRAAGWQPQLTEEQKTEFDCRLD